MADKEATVYIVDVSQSMGECRNGREESDLAFAMNYVWDRITATVATGRKTALVGVVGLSTNETNNSLSEDEAYSSISVLQPLGQVRMPELKKLREEIRPSRNNAGDAVSALVIAIQMINETTKRLKYTRKIVLVTNGLGTMDAEDMDQITGKIKDDSIELTVLGVDFDDLDFGLKEQDKDPNKANNERIFKSLTERCNGNFGTMAQAVAELGIPRLKTTRPVASYKGWLTLGNPEEYDTAMCIDVERYPKIMIATAPSATNHVVRANMAPGESTQSAAEALADGEDAYQQIQEDLATVKFARTYQVLDDEAPGGKRDVDREELAKGYEYGRTAVYISESDENVTKLETRAGLEIVGFVPKDNYEHYMNLSRSSQIIAQKTNEKASMALSSFVHALYELDTYAIGRLVTKDDRPPVLHLLAPSIEADYECVLDVELPFAEDVRSYRFPSLDRIVTVSGKVLTQHRNLPNAQLQRAMNEYVDAMDISAFDRDGQGNAMEYPTMEDTFSPIVHRINQAIRFRAINPTEAVPPPPPILTKYSQPPEELVKTAAPFLAALRDAAEVKKVPPKQLSRKRFDREQPKPLSGLDVNALLSSHDGDGKKRKTVHIDPENAIPSFKQTLAAPEDVATIRTAATQLIAIIHDLARSSFGDRNYGQIVELVGVFRQEMLELEEPGLFNDFLREFKRRCLDGEGGDLGGDRRELWWKVRATKLGLIDKRGCHLSEVGEEEAREFMRGEGEEGEPGS